MTYQKCTPKEGGYAKTLCSAMQEAADFHRPSKKSRGIYRTFGVNASSSADLGVTIKFYSGQFMPDGVFANFCPFCGGALRDFKRDEEQANG